MTGRFILGGADPNDGSSYMARDWTLEFTAVETLEGSQIDGMQFGPPGWEVTFQVRARHLTYEVAILVAPDCPKEDMVRQAMHRFHLQMSELAEDTAGWRLP